MSRCCHSDCDAPGSAITIGVNNNGTMCSARVEEGTEHSLGTNELEEGGEGGGRGEGNIVIIYDAIHT